MASKALAKKRVQVSASQFIYFFHLVYSIYNKIQLNLDFKKIYIEKVKCFLIKMILYSKKNRTLNLIKDETNTSLLFNLFQTAMI